jgi:uncharacterized membrane protein
MNVPKSDYSDRVNHIFEKHESKNRKQVLAMYFPSISEIMNQKKEEKEIANSLNEKEK